MDTPDLCRRARALLLSGAAPRPFDAVIVDEVQDLGPQELLLLAALAGAGPDCLTLVGDGGQRIYGRPISFQALGIDVRGRSHVLCLNYRTTEQIHRFAERILHGSADNLDGERDDQRMVRNLIGGPEPTTQGFITSDEQTRFVVSQIVRHVAEGLLPEDMAVFAPKKDLLEPIKAALQAAGRHYHILSATNGAASGISLGAMHRAKGLEFKVVFVIDVSDGHVPPAWIYWGIKDPQAREEALQREMQLLYVSVTRARDEVYLTCVGNRSRFLEGPSTAVDTRT